MAAEEDEEIVSSMETYVQNGKSGWKGDPLVGVEALKRAIPGSAPYEFAVRRARRMEGGVEHLWCEYSGRMFEVGGEGVGFEVDHRVEVGILSTLCVLAASAYAPKGYYLPWGEEGLAFILRHMNDTSNLAYVSVNAHKEKSALGLKYAEHVRGSTAVGGKERTPLTPILQWYAERQFKRDYEAKTGVELNPSLPSDLSRKYVDMATCMQEELYTLGNAKQRALCGWVARGLGGVGGVRGTWGSMKML